MPMPMLDINCDLGEGEHPARTRALMRQVTSANVACGGHAGDLASMARCVRLSRELGVRLGAHPGSLNRGHFGRGVVHPSPEELTLLVWQQATALQQIAAQQGMALHHIKLHGALYHATEADAELALAYVRVLRDHFPGTKIYSRSGGRVAHTARQLGITVFEEIFSDRAYQSDGNLVPRHEAGALLSRPARVIQRLEHWLDSGLMRAIDGTEIPLGAQTLCIHGDTPGASGLARRIRASIDAYPLK